MCRLVDKKKNLEMCCICGIREAKSRDHIPPKGIFLPPRPSLITVPACDKCNQGSSKDDEKFRAYLSMHSYSSSPIAKRLFWEHTIPRLSRNPKFAHDILNETEPINLISGNIFLGKAFSSKWDSGVHDRVIEKIVRGLYFHHFKEILGKYYSVKTHWFKLDKINDFNFIKQMKLCVIHKDQFAYKYVRTKNKPFVSIWFFNFFNSHLAGGYTVPLVDHL